MPTGYFLISSIAFLFFIFRCEVTKKNAYMQRFSSKNFNVNKTNTTHSFMTPKSMSSEVENIEIKAKNRVGSKH